MTGAAVTGSRFLPDSLYGLWADLRLLVVAVILFTAVVSPQIAFREGAGVCAIIAFFRVASGHRIKTADLLAVAYAALAGFSLVWSDAPHVSMTSFLNASACTAIFLAVRATANRGRDYRLLAYAMIMGSLVSVLLMNGATGVIRWTYQEDAVRLGVDGINLNYTAYSLATTAVIIVSLYVVNPKSGSVVRRVLLIVLFLAMYLGIILTGTRGALLSIALLTGWWMFSRFRQPLAYAVIVAAFILVSLSMMTDLLDRILSNQISVSNRDTGDFNGRLTIWSIAREAFWDAPLLGGGAGSFTEHPMNPWGIPSHSAILDVGTGVGTLGICLFFGTMWWALNRDLINAGSVCQYFIGGSMVIASMPILLSGFWNESPVLWAAVGLLSRCVILIIPCCAVSVDSIGSFGRQSYGKGAI